MITLKAALNDALYRTDHACNAIDEQVSEENLPEKNPAKKMNGKNQSDSDHKEVTQ